MIKSDIDKYRCLNNRTAAHKFNKGDTFKEIVKPFFLQQICGPKLLEKSR